MFRVVRSSSTNGEVTNYYLDVIAKLLEKCNEKRLEDDVPLSDCNHDCVLISPSSVDFVKLYFRGYRKQIYWMQGIDAEESFMKNGSKLRRFVLDIITKFSLKRCIGVFYVSDEMKRYEETKYRVNTEDKSFVMPCFNVSQTEGINIPKGKYEKNIFAYVGSLSKWQCFEETLKFFENIETIDKNAELRVFTFEEDKARKILENTKIKKYTVCSVQPEKMTDALSEIKFGFVLREDDPVNRVATPTKLSSYLSAGVIPIFSIILKDFYSRTRDFNYVVPLYDFTPSEKLIGLMNNKVENEEIVNEYMDLFRTYYNPEYYIKYYENKMKKILELSYD